MIKRIYRPINDKDGIVYMDGAALECSHCGAAWEEYGSKVIPDNARINLHCDCGALINGELEPMEDAICRLTIKRISEIKKHKKSMLKELKEMGWQ